MNNDFIPMTSQLGLKLKDLQPRVKAAGNTDIKSRYDTVCEEYRFMLKFFAEGVSDPQREEMLRAMKKRVYVIESDVRRIEFFKSNAAYSALMKLLPAELPGTMAMTEGLRRGGITPKDHFKTLNDAFLTIFFSLAWKEQDSRMWTAYLIDDTVSSADAQTIVSAITLSCVNGFCMEKMRTLAYVYLTSRDERVRQRALVGWVLNAINPSGTPFEKEYADMARELLAEEGAEEDVLKTILQVIHCKNTESDNKKLNDEIMPEIMKSSKFRITPNGIKEKEDDSMDEILNPGKYEEQMEKLENSFEKVRQMQDSGADVFYSGFSMMKRYPFFYKLSNWFVPFMADHPDMSGVDYGEKKDHLLGALERNISLCDSDKYSFVFALQSVLPNFPEEMREALLDGNGLMARGNRPDWEEIVNTPEFVRRMYLQNMYRFFKLNPQVKVRNLFEELDWMRSLMLSSCMSKESRVELCKFLLRRNYTDDASRLATSLKGEGTEADLLYAAVKAQKGEMNESQAIYNQILKAEPECVPALKGLAKTAFLSCDYDATLEAFTSLVRLFPDNMAYQINKDRSGVMAGKAQEYLNDIYRLDLENEDNPKIKRLLAWTLLCLGRFDQARDIYKKILRSTYGDATENDMMCLIDLYWTSRDVKSCLELLGEYRKLYLKELTDKESCDRLAHKLKSEARELYPYYPSFSSEIGLLLDAFIFLQSPSSSDD